MLSIIQKSDQVLENIRLANATMYQKLLVLYMIWRNCIYGSIIPKIAFLELKMLMFAWRKGMSVPGFAAPWCSSLDCNLKSQKYCYPRHQPDSILWTIVSKNEKIAWAVTSKRTIPLNFEDCIYSQSKSIYLLPFFISMIGWHYCKVALQLEDNIFLWFTWCCWWCCVVAPDHLRHNTDTGLWREASPRLLSCQCQWPPGLWLVSSQDPGLWLAAQLGWLQPPPPNLSSSSRDAPRLPPVSPGPHVPGQVRLANASNHK